MKSYFTKFGALLLCGVMLAVVGCHDYDEDINKVDDKVNTLVGQVEDLDKELDKATADLEASLKDNYATKEVVNGIQSTLDAAIKANAAEIKKANDAIKANATNVAANTSAIATAQTAVSNLQKALTEANDKIAAAEAAIALKANDAELKALAVTVNDLAKDVDAIEALLSDEKTGLTALNAAVTNLNASVSALESGLNKANDNIASNLVKIEALQEDVKTAKQNISDNAAAIKVLADADLITRVATLEGAQKTLEQSLNTKVAELTKAYGEADAALKSELLGEIKKVNDALTTVKTDVTNLQTAVSGIQTTIGTLATKDALNQVKSDIENAYKDADAKLQGLIEGLTTRVDKAEKDIASLIKRVQSIVYVPTHVDGMARINYAKLGDEILEGFSTLTYKVYPAELAADLAKVVKNFSYDVITVTKSNGSPLQVVDVTNPEGTNVIEVKALANGLDLLYDSESKQSYAAALVLSDDDNHYSTEYTNLVAVADAEVDMVLYVGDNKYTTPAEYGWYYVASGSQFQATLLEGLHPRFSYKGTDYKAADLLTDFGYEIAYTVEPKLTKTPADAKGIQTSIQDETKYVLASPAEQPKKAYVDNKLDVEYVYTYAGNKTKSAFASVLVKPFPYRLVVANPEAIPTYTVSYVDGLWKQAILPSLEVYFVDENDARVEISELAKTYSSLVLNKSYALSGAAEKLFAVVEGTDYPVTLALAKENDKIKAVKEDVGKKVEVTYTFSIPVIEEDINVSTTVEITPAHYKFYLGGAEPALVNWEYTAGDAKIEAAILAGDKAARYSRSFNGLAIDNPVQNDVVYSKLPFGTEYVDYVVKADGQVVDPETYAVNVSVDQDGAPHVKFSGFEWNKTYTVEANYQLVGATATVYFSFKTVDRERDTIYSIVLPEETMDYSADFTFDVKDAVNDMAKWTAIIPEVSQGANFSFDAYLKDVVANKIYDVALVDGVKDELANTGIEFTADYLSVNTTFSYADFKTINDKVVYVYDFVADYGQKFQITKTVNFTMPEFAFGHNTYYYYEDGGYSAATGRYTPELGVPVENFAIDDIKMLSVFNKLYNVNTPDKVIMTQTEWPKYLKVVFNTVKDEYSSLMKENVFTYNSPAESIAVTATLYLVNSNGVSRAVKTNFNEGGAYANYYIKKYDPFKSMSVAPYEVKLRQNKVYEVESLRELLTLVDCKNREVITNGVINTGNYTYNTNFYGLELDFDVEAALAEVAKDVDLAPYVKITEIPSTDPEKPYMTDATVVFDYTSDLKLTKGFVIEIPVTYKHLWGSQPGTVKINFVLAQ